MFIIRFIGRIILALVLAVVTNWISWFVIYRGKGVMFLFFLVLLRYSLLGAGNDLGMGKIPYDADSICCDGGRANS